LLAGDVAVAEEIKMAVAVRVVVIAKKGLLQNKP
jgi:hypothetical protein